MSSLTPYRQLSVYSSVILTLTILDLLAVLLAISCYYYYDLPRVATLMLVSLLG